MDKPIYVGVASVTKDTPLIQNEGEIVKILGSFENNNEEACYRDDYVITQWETEEFAICNGIHFYTREGWKLFKNML